MECSIIICTRNRAVMLERTLHAFQAVIVPEGWGVEMIVADNGSTDETSRLVNEASHPTIEIRYVYQSRPGKSRSLNVAVAVAKGEILLFTDDDVVPESDWLCCMARPLLEKRCDAVAGRIRLNPELYRSWQTHMHGVWLADVPRLAQETPELVGASMGIHRTVSGLIDGFDEELGPGASGFGEDTLFWMQMKEAGLRIEAVHDTFVTHYPDPSRLTRSSWLSTATRYGKTRAYLAYHWEHSQVPCPALHALFVSIKLILRRMLRRPVRPDDEGCPAWEMSYLVRIESLMRYIEESKKPRNYECRALRTRSHLRGLSQKLTGDPDESLVDDMRQNI